MSEPKTRREGSYGEPWRIDERDFGLVDSNDCEVEVGLPEFDQRIVSCVNALSGIEDPAAWREAVRDLAEAAEPLADLSVKLEDALAALARVQGGGPE